MTPGMRLRNLRKMRGLTQIELAAALRDRYGISIENGSISSYEKDGNTPPPQTYDLLADFFDVSLGYLRCLPNEPNPKPPAILHPEVLEFSERLNGLPNGLIRAVIEVSNTMIDKMVELDRQLDDRLVGLRARMAAQRGENGLAEWEKERGIRLPRSSENS